MVKIINAFYTDIYLINCYFNYSGFGICLIICKFEKVVKGFYRV